MSETIENHGIVGDMRTIALVDLHGTIDFMCWPRFDSPSIFASLLDDKVGGSFELAPTVEATRRRQLYLPDTNVLLTRFLSSDGVAEIMDFMQIDDATHKQSLIRRVKAVRSTMRIRMRCAPAFGYAQSKHRVHAEGHSVVFTPAQSQLPALRLWSPQPLRIRAGAAVAQFELKAGESAIFVLEDAKEGAAAQRNDASYHAEAFKQTSNYWRHWVSKSNYRGRWRDAVTRSSLILKLLTSREQGSIIAAPTFGLPESLHGHRNWDYRYTWMRDSAFTVYAFLRLGYTDEADAFMQWLSARASGCHPNGSLHVMYNFDGESQLAERTLPKLRGYENSRPVRIGNEASQQFQLDIYGAVMDAVYLADKYGKQLSSQGWEGVSRSINWVMRNWRRADQGIWEIRTRRRQFLHSRVMCWVALDRAMRLARKRGLPAPLTQWSRVRDEIYQSIHREFWDPKLHYFIQSKGTKAIDASCLLMPLVRFISPTDPRWLSTLQAVSEKLTDDSLVYRYSDKMGFDGLDGKEGTFNMCSFWYVECLARAGDLPKARFYFEKMLGYANHLGLFAEETGPAGEQLGNFPQAFTHMALISAAFFLDRALSAKT